MAKVLEKNARANGPSWAAVERSPEAGARRSETRRVFDNFQKTFDDKCEVDYSNGDVYFKPHVARWDRETNAIAKGLAWGATREQWTAAANDEEPAARAAGAHAAQGRRRGPREDKEVALERQQHDDDKGYCQRWATYPS